MLDGGTKTEQINFVRQQLFVEKPVWNRMMVDKTLPKRLHALEELSRNLWWCWNPGARGDLFEGIDPALWAESDRNPIAFLDKMSVERMKELEKDTNFLAQLDAVHTQFRDYAERKPDPKATTVSYFSMEYGLHSSLKIYSGGLGILAGDYLKEASDKNVPMAAVGLLYRYGYFTQRLSAQGAQEATYEAQNFYKLPISPVRDEAGGWVTVTIAFPGRTLSARVWKCQVGRTDLYLLDADIEDNLEEDRQITHYLYGGDWENRLKQEILLGIGGIRALRQLGIKHDVFHCNEGPRRVHRRRAHPRPGEPPQALVLRGAGGGALVVALHDAHPVPAGHDAFPRVDDPPVHVALSRRAGHHLGAVYQPGQDQSQRPERKFSMSVLACNLSQEVNGVSWLHGEVSKEILGNMWPGYFKNELQSATSPTACTSRRGSPRRCAASTPVTSATDSRDMSTTSRPGRRFTTSPTRTVEGAHEAQEQAHPAYPPALQRPPRQVRLDSPRQMLQVIEGIKPEVLTIGFARRFATYKRAYLLFTNLDRLAAIVNNKASRAVHSRARPTPTTSRAGPHPGASSGVAAMPQFVGKILFLQNYDMELARRMVQGVDVWLNTPTRPLEASGPRARSA